MPTRRLFLLYGVGCFRAAWSVLDATPYRLTVEAVEAAADGQFRPNVLELRQRDDGHGYPPVRNAAEALRWAAYTNRMSGDFHACVESATRVAKYLGLAFPQAKRLFRDLYRDLLIDRSNVLFNPAWLTSTVRAVAAGVYESRDFSGLPVLADALQEAGCDDSVILDHCRTAGWHARGCWVVDAILGK